MSSPVEIVLVPVAAGGPRPEGKAGEFLLCLDSRQWACDVLAMEMGTLAGIQRILVAVEKIPTLDQMLAASLLAWRVEAGGKLGAGAEAFARYAALARGGFSPSRLAPELTLAGIYQAITWPFGDGLTSESSPRFLKEWQRVAAVVRAAIDGGRDPFTEALFSEAQGFAQEIISLRSDRQVYGQDVKAGMRFTVRLPAAAAENSALILRHPKSLLFKDWARTDPQSPTGDGYLLLGVEWDDEEWVFSTDPVQRISLLPLAEALDAGEREKAPAGTEVARWFDGAPFHHSLIASPKTGSHLSPTDVLRVFCKWASARAVQPPRAKGPRWRWPAMAAAIALMATAAWWAFARTSPPMQPQFPDDPSIAATELDEVHIRTLKSRGTSNANNLALFVGINEFRNHEFPQLTFAVDDAIAQAHLFSLELDLIDPGNLILAIQGTPGTRRGAAQLKELTAKGATITAAFRSDILANLMKLATISQQREVGGLLIVSVSSHGIELPTGAYVIPHDGLRSSPEQDIAVSALGDLMNKARAGKHLLLVDACRETPKSDSRDVPPAMAVSFLEALAAAKGQKVMASCSAGQLSYELPAKGHGIFTYWLLMGLKGQAGADGRGMITVGTMQRYLSSKVPEFSSRNAPGLQVPWFSADDGSEEIPLAVSAEKP